MSCENNVCISFSRDYLIVQFLDSTETRKNIEIDYITALGSEYIFYSDTSLNRIGLPINTGESQTAFIFRNVNSRTDTLVVGYSQQQRLISPSCGFELQYRQLQVLNTSFPGSTVQFDELNILNDTDIKIYH
ncbi:MAG: hypothetical protein KFF73_00860 [Cyclobacteriaceae bacterium]|nr:hypothetical protein [Cyclobacteriaceae bacterium]